MAFWIWWRSFWRGQVCSVPCIGHCCIGMQNAVSSCIYLFSELTIHAHEKSLTEVRLRYVVVTIGNVCSVWNCSFLSQNLMCNLNSAVMFNMLCRLICLTTRVLSWQRLLTVSHYHIVTLRILHWWHTSPVLWHSAAERYVVTLSQFCWTVSRIAPVLLNVARRIWVCC